MGCTHHSGIAKAPSSYSSIRTKDTRFINPNTESRSERTLDGFRFWLKTKKTPILRKPINMCAGASSARYRRRTLLLRRRTENAGDLGKERRRQRRKIFRRITPRGGTKQSSEAYTSLGE